MRLLNAVKIDESAFDLSAGYGTIERQDFNWTWNKKYIPPLNEVEMVGEFCVNENVSPEDYRIYHAVGGDIDQFKSVKEWINHPGGAEFPSPEGSIWREDDIKEALKNHRYDYRVLKKPIEMKMPIIKHCNPDAIKPPLLVTKDWYCDKLEKRVIENAKNHKLDQINIMELIIERDAIKDKLGMLDRRKPKDAKRILKLNCRLKDIQAQIEWLEAACGKNEKVDYGSKFGRVCRRVKNVVTSACKTVKKAVSKTLKKIGDFLQFDDKDWAIIGQVAVVALVGIVTKNFGKVASVLFGKII